MVMRLRWYSSPSRSPAAARPGHLVERGRRCDGTDAASIGHPAPLSVVALSRLSGLLIRYAAPEEEASFLGRYTRCITSPTSGSGSCSAASRCRV
jgi:hypothetical protein